MLLIIAWGAQDHIGIYNHNAYGTIHVGRDAGCLTLYELMLT